MIDIDRAFPVEQQRRYVLNLKGKIGLTKRRAEYFVKLWAYLLLKQQRELGTFTEITELSLPDGFVPCTHREAADIFYGHQERGSDRAAGMMIDKLVALGLIEKEFDGNNICLRIPTIPTNLQDYSEPPESVLLIMDEFKGSTDTIPVASFLARNYNWMNNKANTAQKIASLLRSWSEQYPKCLRVLRRADTRHPVGFYALYPTAKASEDKFFLPPSQSLHLSSTKEIDPIKMAIPGDLSCMSIFIRSFQIDTRYKQRPQLCQILKDLQATLIQMQADFPRICDIYTLLRHPSDEDLPLALGFQKLTQDPQSLYWMYISLEQFLTIDVEQAVSILKFY